MPKHPWPIWLLTIILLIGYPVTALVYYPLELETWSPEERLKGDSLSIPLGLSFLVAFFATPLFMGLTWFCLRRYRGGGSLFVWRSDRLIRTVLVTLILGSPAAIILIATVISIPQSRYWFDLLWPAYSVLLSAYLLCLRAALVDQYSKDEWEVPGW